MKDSDLKLSEIRRRNDETLRTHMDAIRDGSDTGPLLQFAKAYLGAFARTEDGRDAAARVGLVANPDLAAAALAGFEAALRRSDIPSARQIGAATVDGSHDALAYILLAGVDRTAGTAARGVSDVPPRALVAALCYHYAHIVSDDAQWIESALRERADIAGQALRDFWVAMAARGARYLPGFNQFDGRPDRLEIMQHVLVPLLQAWRRCSDRTLRSLLHAALRYADAESLSCAARAVLSRPDGLSGNAVVYWRGTELLLDPTASTSTITALIGRSKEKALRLLDFVVPPLEAAPGRTHSLPPEALAELLRLIGPIFPPQGDLGKRQAAIEQKVLWLFDLLGEDSSEEARTAVRRLRRVRVMRRCSAVLDRVERAQAARRARRA
jgi:hypothetical protein